MPETIQLTRAQIAAATKDVMYQWRSDVADVTAEQVEACMWLAAKETLEKLFADPFALACAFTHYAGIGNKGIFYDRMVEHLNEAQEGIPE